MWHLGPAQSVAAFQRRSFGIWVRRNDGTIGRVSRHARWAIVKKLCTDLRAQAIGAHQGADLYRLFAITENRDGFTVLFIALDLVGGPNIDEATSAGCFEEERREGRRDARRRRDCESVSGTAHQAGYERSQRP